MVKTQTLNEFVSCKQKKYNKRISEFKNYVQKKYYVFNILSMIKHMILLLTKENTEINRACKCEDLCIA